jgi:hypothetical protein
MRILSWLGLSLLVACFTPLTSGGTSFGFNPGPFFSLVGSSMSMVDSSLNPIEANYLTVTLSAAAPSDTYVMITSSDPSLLSVVGGGVTVPTGMTSAQVLVYSYALGTVTVTGFLEATARTATIHIVSSIPVATSLQITPLLGAVQLTWPTNASGYLLETNSNLANPAGWSVWTSDYSILSTNFSVTTPTTNSAQFYRLRLP